MNKLKNKLVLILAIMLLSTQLSSGGGIPNDKRLHIAAGLLTYVGCITIGKIAKDLDIYNGLDYKNCVWSVIGVAAIKEGYDSRHTGHTAELMDFVATIAIPLSFTIYEVKF